MATPTRQKHLVYVGTYTDHISPAGGQAEGIYVYSFDPATGVLSPLSVSREIPNPTYLALHPNGRYLYTVNEVGQFQNQPGGSVSAFALDPDNGTLVPLNQQGSQGAYPCFISLDGTGRWAFVANFGGSVAILPINASGHLLPATDMVDHRALSAEPARNTAAHAHSLIPDPHDHFGLAADLGLDQVLIYRLNLEQGQLQPHASPGVRVAEGAGPRHLDFHPNGRYVYLVNELHSTVTAFAYDPDTGYLQVLQTLSTLPVGYAGRRWSADIHVAPSGRYLYVSNRAHDSLAIFAVDPDSGRLQPAGHVPAGGQTPRNFAIDPSGVWLLAAHQESDTITAFRIDPDSGQLGRVEPVASVPSPVCIKFLVSAR